MLKELAVDYDVIDYLKHPPSAAELDAICKGLGVEPLEIIRTKDKKFRELGLSKEDQRSRNEWLKLMEENPAVIERPIVVKGGKVILGRPPESVKKIID